MAGQRKSWPGEAWQGTASRGMALGSNPELFNKKDIMKNIEFKIIGKTAFLFNKFNIENVSNKSKVKSGSAGNDPEEWKLKCIAEGKNLYLPGYYIFSCLSEGGNYVKEGRGSIKKKLMGCLLINTPKFYLNYELPKDIDEIETEDLSKDSSQKIYLDVRAVKNPMTKGKNVRYRLAMCPGWSTNVIAEWDDTIISKENMKQVIESAGKFVGVGDARLLGYGRFTCEDVKIS